ncbi:hypothetical protein LINPERPRIM_LOCUS1013 [Linum perenne]
MTRKATIEPPSMPSAGTGNVTGVPPKMPANHMNINMDANIINENHIRPPIQNGSTMLFVGELHWWTTDAELESVCSQYGNLQMVGGTLEGEGDWGRGAPGVLGGPIRGRGGMSAKSMIGGAAGVGGGFNGVGYGQGFGGPGFPGMLPSFPDVNAMGPAGVVPHVNPAFFGRGMAPNAIGMMVSSGMEGPGMGMWSETSMGGWGEEHGRKTRESSYGAEDGASNYGYGEANQEKGGRSSTAPREKERSSARDMPPSDRRHRDEREQIQRNKASYTYYIVDGRPITP